MPARSRPSSHTGSSLRPKHISLDLGRKNASDNGSDKVKDQQYWDADRRKDFLNYGTSVFFGTLAFIILYMMFRNPASHTANTSPATPPTPTPPTPSEIEEIISKVLMKAGAGILRQ